MDEKTFRLVATARIDEIAKQVHPDSREDFVQDMWVHLLSVDAFRAFHEKDLPPGQANVGSFINLVLFRAQDNWMAKHRSSTRGVPTDPEVFDEIAAESDVDDAHDAGVALRLLREALTARFQPEEVELVISGLKNGETQLDIAKQLGQVPAVFYYYFMKARSARKAA